MTRDELLGQLMVDVEDNEEEERQNNYVVEVLVSTMSHLMRLNIRSVEIDHTNNRVIIHLE
jgi:hypothetical protein